MFYTKKVCFTSQMGGKSQNLKKKRDTPTYLLSNQLSAVQAQPQFNSHWPESQHASSQEHGLHVLQSEPQSHPIINNAGISNSSFFMILF